MHQKQPKGSKAFAPKSLLQCTHLYIRSRRDSALREASAAMPSSPNCLRQVTGQTMQTGSRSVGRSSRSIPRELRTSPRGLRNARAQQQGAACNDQHFAHSPGELQLEVFQGAQAGQVGHSCIRHLTHALQQEEREGADRGGALAAANGGAHTQLN